MDPLFALGLILVSALLAGHGIRLLRVPEVTAYILAGVALGPSVLGWINSENVASLHVMSEVALGLILFAVGAVFSFAHFRRVGRRVFVLTVVESSVTGALVLAAMLMIGQPWQIAALLATISMSTAPAATLMILREEKSQGPLTDAIQGAVAVNKVVVLASFALCVAIVRFSLSDLGSDGVLSVLFESAFRLIWELAGSVALGFLVGLMLAGWGARIVDGGEVQMLLAGSILLCVGLALWLGLSPLLASLAVGATLVNLSSTSQRLTAELSRLDPPFYAIFFVVAGADLDIGRIRLLGAVGTLYIVARGLGKFFGARFGARVAGFDRRTATALGFSLLAQADLALGLSLEISRQFPQYALTISTIVLGAVCIFELLGPIGTRHGVLLAGEARAKTRVEAGLWDQP